MMGTRRPPAPDLPERGPLEPPAARERGHAFYASQARRALGIAPAHVLPRLPDVPAPVFQGLVAVAASVLCVALRPEVIGTRAAVGLDAVLIVVTCAAILHHARLLVPEGARPGAEVCALPAAALLALAVAAAGTPSVWAGGLAVVVTGIVGTLVPYLDARRLAGHDSAVVRIGVDIGAVVAMVPLALLGASGGLTPVARAALAGLGGAALCYDALRIAGPLLRTTLVGSLTVGLAVVAAVPPAGRVASQAAGATGILLLWYGLRGVSQAVQHRPLARAALVEYTAFVAAAVAFLTGAWGS